MRREGGRALAQRDEKRRVGRAQIGAAERLLAQAREERKPSVLETVTYRYRGHSVADAGKVYRTAEEIESWRRRDPISCASR